MNHKIRIIKHGDQRPQEPEVERPEQPSGQSARDVSTTIKLWVSEFKDRRHADQQRSRIANKLGLTTISVSEFFK